MLLLNKAHTLSESLPARCSEPSNRCYWQHHLTLLPGCWSYWLERSDDVVLFICVISLSETVSERLVSKPGNLPSLVDDPAQALNCIWPSRQWCPVHATRVYQEESEKCNYDGGLVSLITRHIVQGFRFLVKKGRRARQCCEVFCPLGNPGELRLGLPIRSPIIFPA